MIEERNLVNTASRKSPVKRIVFYLFHDNRGEVDDYVLYKLRALRPFVQHIFVVVNGTLVPEAEDRLQAVADTVWQRENSGFDVGGYQAALSRVGEGFLADFDELIMMNYTWFGPVRPFAPLFERMDALDVDFWGLTDHERVVPNPYTNTGELPRHLQSHWIAVRRAMFQSERWRQYWREMPVITGYTESILNHELRFTKYFSEAGFRYDTAFPVTDFPDDHPAMLNPDQLLSAGCPALKRRVFFHYPPYLDRHAVIGRWLARRASSFDYPLELIWQNLSRTVAPRTVNAAAQMLEVLPECDSSFDPDRPPRVAAILHLPDEGAAAELLARVSMLPVAADLFVTTTSATRTRAISELLDRSGSSDSHREIRVVPSSRGHDLSAFFVACRDVLRSGNYDLVVKVHGTVVEPSTSNAARLTSRYLLENVLSSPGYAAALLALFQREPGLGVVYPPLNHIGQTLMGRAWGGYHALADSLAKKLKIRVPLDHISPLAPFGGFWVCRPEALRILIDEDWDYADYEAEDKPRDSGLAAIQERLVSHAAGELGYHTRTVLNGEHASISHSALEYKLDLMSSTTPGYALEQIQTMHRFGYLGTGSIRTFARMQVRLNMPRTARVLRPAMRVARDARRMLRSWRHRPTPELEREVSEERNASDQTENGELI